MGRRSHSRSRCVITVCVCMRGDVSPGEEWREPVDHGFMAHVAWPQSSCSRLLRGTGYSCSGRDERMWISVDATVEREVGSYIQYMLALLRTRPWTVEDTCACCTTALRENTSASLLRNFIALY